MDGTPTPSDTLYTVAKNNNIMPAKLKTAIPFKKINLGDSLTYIKPLIESGYIGLGDIVFQMEKQLAEYVGAKHVVALDSCTSALFLSLKWEYQHHEVDEVSIPSMTVPLALNAALEAGMKVKLDDRTNWVGKYYDMNGSCVIDSAHELRRNQYKKLSAENPDHDLKLCFSFYPTKTIGSADGGAIATDNEAFANWARSAATYGRNQKSKYQNSWEYDVDMVGYKRHYTNLQAAIVLEQLHRLDQTNFRRQAIVARYNEAFNRENDSDYLYRINMDNRDKFIQYMKDQGIECGVHFKPLHLMTPFKKLKVQNPDEIERMYKMTVSLPLYDTLTDKEVEYIIWHTNKFMFKQPI